ncbi:MAG: rhamnan synthesis F family protein, partial [Dysgonomonas sp.]
MKKLAIFAHYDAENATDQYLNAIFNQLLPLVDRVLIITTSGFEPTELEATATSDKVTVIKRENQGYDFYSYRYGLYHEKDIHQYEQIILLNDSFYCLDNFNAKTILEASRNFDVYSITSSNQIAFHLQSYFLVFNKRIISSKWFFNFWKNVFMYKNKFKIVMDYEIGLSCSAIAHNYKLGSAYKCTHDKNPTHHDWHEIMENIGILKIDGIRNRIIKNGINELAKNPIFISHISRTEKFYTNRILSGKKNIISGKNFFEFISTKNKKSDVAIILHLFYHEMRHEIKEYFSRIPFPFDLYITVTDESKIKCVIETFNGVASGLFISVVENKGCDVKPFIDVMNNINFEQYVCVAKVHSKKSTYSKHGDEWRQELFTNLFPSALELYKLRDRFRQNKIGIMANRKNYLSNEIYWGANKNRFDFLCEKLNVPHQKRELFFVGGTMFWFKPSAIYPLVKIIREMEFEDELNQQDGTLAHTVERLICIAAYSKDFECHEISEPYEMITAC